MELRSLGPMLTIVLLSVPVCARAQTPIGDYYDTAAKPTTVKGVMRASVASPGLAPSMILIEVPGEGGKPPTNWLIAGRPAYDLQREGLYLIGPKAALKSGDAITVSGYRPKPGSKAAETIATALQESAPPGVKAGFVDELQQKDVKLLHAIDIVLSNGTKLSFGETSGQPH